MDSTRTSVSKEFTFHAAHRLLHDDGPCHRLHGHTYRVRVRVSGPVDAESGMVLNFRKLDFVKELLDKEFDHTLMLSSRDPLWDLLLPAGVVFAPIHSEPTAENIAAYLFRFIQQRGHEVEAVTVWETPKCSATVRRCPRA